MTRQSLALAMILLLGTACSGDSPPLDVDGYVDEVRAVAAQFRADFEKADELGDFPIEGELTNAAAGYMAYDDAAERLRTLAPPPEISSAHELVVVRLDAVQGVVGEYLDKASRERGFTFDRLEADPVVREHLDALAVACAELSVALDSAGADPIPVACGLLGP